VRVRVAYQKIASSTYSSPQWGEGMKYTPLPFRERGWG